MELECKRCGKVWGYTGSKKPHKDYPQYVSCPRCKTVVKLITRKEVKDDRTK